MMISAMDQSTAAIVPTGASNAIVTTTSASKSLQIHESQHQSHERLLVRLLRKTGVLFLLLLLVKLVANEPLFAYVLQYYSHSGNPLTLRLWKTLGADLLI